jgi:hypothetical protein
MIALVQACTFDAGGVAFDAPAKIDGRPVGDVGDSTPEPRDGTKEAGQPGDGPDDEGPGTEFGADAGGLPDAGQDQAVLDGAVDLGAVDLAPPIVDGTADAALPDGMASTDLLLFSDVVAADQTLAPDLGPPAILFEESDLTSAVDAFDKAGGWQENFGDFCGFPWPVAFTLPPANAWLPTATITASDYTIKTRMEFHFPTLFASFPTGGIAFRFNPSAQEGYLCGVEKDGARLVLAKLRADDPLVLAQQKISLEATQRLRAAASGNNLTCQLELNSGQTVTINAVDSTHPSGTVGLAVRQIYACFDSLSVTTP